jgi:hypothetical protein
MLWTRSALRNDVVRMDNAIAPGTVWLRYQNCGEGSVSRRLNVKIAAQLNMLEFKSYFQNRSCGGGSPYSAAVEPQQ